MAGISSEYLAALRRNSHLEDVTAALGDAGADMIADRMTARYVDFNPVHEALIQTFQAASPTA
jgi:hypothetical protein